MQSGKTKRNIAVAMGYLVVLPLVITIALVTLPFAAAVAVARNYRGAAERLAQLPGVSSEGGAKAGLAVFAYNLVIYTVMGTLGGGPSEEDPETSLDGADNTPTPTVEAADGGGQTQPTETDKDQTQSDDGDEGGIQLLAEKTYADYGTLTGISNSGNLAVFGLHTGQFVVYDTDTNSFNMLHSGVDRQPSHILLRDDGYATVAWMDAHGFGAIDITGSGGTQWLIESNGLWDIDTSADHTTVGAVTSPAEGPGRVGVVNGNGEILWDQPLENAMSESVAVTNRGEYLAIGASEYYDGTEKRGTSGVRLYDAKTGEHQWTYETDSDVLSVAIHGERELIVAGTNAGGILVLDFDGNVLWETDKAGGWVELSGDGRTVVTGEINSMMAFNAEIGEVEWQADDVPGWASQHIEVSHDGDRVAASETGIGHVFLVDTGEVIWQEEHQEGPAFIDLSADGATWSVIIQDNDTGEAHVEIYRDNDRET